MVALGRLANVAVSSAWQLTVALSELTMVAQGSQAQLRRIHREIEEASVSVFTRRRKQRIPKSRRLTRKPDCLSCLPSGLRVPRYFGGMGKSLFHTSHET